MSYIYFHTILYRADKLNILWNSKYFCDYWIILDLWYVVSLRNMEVILTLESVIVTCWDDCPFIHWKRLEIGQTLVLFSNYHMEWYPAPKYFSNKLFCFLKYLRGYNEYFISAFIAPMYTNSSRFLDLATRIMMFLIHFIYLPIKSVKLITVSVYFNVIHL